MNHSSPPPTLVDLTNCDREPIHLLGAIQPSGFLLTVNADWIVVRASENTNDHVALPAEQIVGGPVEACLTPAVLHEIRGQLQLAAGPDIVERLFGQRLVADGPLFDIAMHQSGQELVLEFEPADEPDNSALGALKTMFARLERHRAQYDLCREAARQVRMLTGFDRVMVYRFDDEGAGEVVAEAAKNGLASYLGLRYPASDIPAQARALYIRNIVRNIVDVDAAPVPISPALSPEGAPLDLSMSGLRGVSPIHLEYLRNMGVGASMSISILRGGLLWGLIACHHYEPHRVGLQTRSMAELFGQMFSYLMETRCREEEAAHDERVKDVHQRLSLAFSSREASLSEAPESLIGLSDHIAADGIGAYLAGEVTLTGLTPTREEFLRLVGFLNRTATGRIFSTHCLKDAFPPAADFVARAAGLLAVPISRIPRDYLVFFRREVAKTVTWAGEPTKLESIGPLGPRLTPRKSFEAWRETVQHQSERWSARDVRTAEALRITLIELVLRVTDQAQTDQVDADQRNEIMIAELNHRLRNILGLVRGLITQSARFESDVGLLADSLGERIRAMAKAYELLSIGNWKPASLHDLLRAELDAFDPARARLRLTGPDVLLQPRALSAMALVGHELATNARKYGALSTATGRVTVETTADEAGNVTISWREADGPPVVPPTRRGLGSTILEQVIPFEVEGTASVSYSESGFVMECVIPAASAAMVPAQTAAHAPTPVDDLVDPADFGPLLNTCLVVEDNLFIALDVEDALRKLGAGRIDIARSVVEALTLKSERRYSFALLDVTLGAENSLPVARALIAQGTPFIFGTGYGEAHRLDPALDAVPVISKPYHIEALARTLSRLCRRSEAWQP